MRASLVELGVFGIVAQAIHAEPAQIVSRGLRAVVPKWKALARKAPDERLRVVDLILSPVPLYGESILRVEAGEDPPHYLRNTRNEPVSGNGKSAGVPISGNVNVPDVTSPLAFT